MKATFGVSVASLVALALPASTALASAQLPPIAVEQTFPNHATCLTHLESTWAADRATEVPQHRRADRTIERRWLETEGVQRVDAATARYEATRWVSFGWERPEVNSREWRSTREHQVQTCNGAVMTTVRDGGSSNRFEDLTPAAAH